ncbi:Uncharacterized protein XB16_2151 [Leptospira santarosai]|uniref:Uncharacterized protein n=1 Tax=Leptospira santarosai TaxID=28183 RepID=A0A2P1QUQ0_9LEPT|nr:Uncharacterized protein XB16_2151 [Leptospira santarosai]
MNFSSNENCQTAVLRRNSIGEFLFLDFIEVPYATRNSKIPNPAIENRCRNSKQNRERFLGFFSKEGFEKYDRKKLNHSKKTK